MKKHNLYYGHDGKYKEIDRDVEDSLVLKYQETKDEKILEQILLDRVPTLINWVKKEYYTGLDMTEEDFFSELCSVLLKAVDYHDKKRGNFNTCLWNFLDNRIRNIKNRTHAKKRKSENPALTRSTMMLSFDYKYEDFDLHDIISDEDIHHGVQFKDILMTMANGDKVVYDALYELSVGESISEIIRKSKIVESYIKVNDAPSNKTEAKKIISKNIKSKDSFKLLDYNIIKDLMYYKIELKKTENSKKIQSYLRKIKANKEEYIGILDVAK